MQCTFAGREKYCFELQSTAMTSLPHQVHLTFCTVTVYTQYPSLHPEHDTHAYACADTVLEVPDLTAVAVLWPTSRLALTLTPAGASSMLCKPIPLQVCGHALSLGGLL